MEDFVTFEIAKKLKEKGFPIKTKTEGKWGLTELKEVDTLPTISQVLKWLREEKKIHIAIGYSGETKWRYVVIYLDDVYFCNPNITKKRFDKWGQAALAGVNYCLDNLI